MISGDKVFYFFSLNGEYFIDSTKPYESIKDDPSNEELESISKIFKEKRPDYVNFIEKIALSKVELTQSDLNKMICKPRIKGPKEWKEEVQKAKKVVASVWTPYKPDTMDILWKCFQIDFQNSKIPKIVKDPVE